MDSNFISDKAKIHSSVKIGPYCVIGENVEIGENCTLQSHVVITGNTKIGQKDRKSTRLNSSHSQQSRMPSSA